MYFQWSLSVPRGNASRISIYSQWSVYLMMKTSHACIVGYALIALCMIPRIHWSVGGAVKETFRCLKWNLTINVVFVSQAVSLQGLRAWQRWWWLNSINKFGACPQEKQKNIVLPVVTGEMSLHGPVKITTAATGLTELYAEVSQLFMLDCQVEDNVQN